MSGAILIYSCQKYKHSRIQDLAYLQPEYEGWRVLFFVGDPFLTDEYRVDGNVVTLRCEDSYLHLLKKTILGFKVAMELVPNLTGILKCGDDIVFNETELVRFIRSEDKYDYMGVHSPDVSPNGKHYDSWIVEYYKKHPEDFQNPYHGLPSMDVVKSLDEVPTIQAASGPLTYFSRRSCDYLVQHMEGIGWNILQHSEESGYIYIIEEPGISFILYPYGIRPVHYRTFTESRKEFQQTPFIGLHTNNYKWTCPKRVCIIGAGWYGCHAARFLRSRGCDVRILDREGIFAGASSKNQNRLHLGYHYPRSPETIRECQTGYVKFIDEYGSCVVPFPKNLYFIHKDSKTPIQTFRDMYSDYAEQHIPFVTHDLETSLFVVKETCIDNVLAKKRMEDELSPLVQICESPVVEVTANRIQVNGVDYDYVLNCTNNQYAPIPTPFTPIYETVCTLLYHIACEETTAYTVMDGPFFSIFPYDSEKQLYTVTHVLHSVISKGPTLSNPTIDSESIRRAIESEMFHVFPHLKGICEYSGYFTSKKTKYDYETDDRSLRWFQSGRYFSFSGGKITGMFEMEPVLLDKVINASEVNL